MPLNFHTPTSPVLSFALRLFTMPSLTPRHLPGSGTASRTATLDLSVEESFNFAVALTDVDDDNPQVLSFKRGTLIESIEVLAHGKTRRFEGRIRCATGSFVSPFETSNIPS
jgi:hypothetical protein